ncbi:MAG TPA: Holliday junction branch migration protein RuvA [Firmicutes bacterium]|nr:Holliday junction branch migration protein RuvA [Candidatus Fermentithermobacillaceae bacterium]
MISELRGTVSQIYPDSVTLDIHGIGLQVYVTPGLLGTLSAGMEIHLFTRLIVKEDGWSLYGFKAQEERACFELLLNVKGIGPKLALGIMSKLRPDDFYKAVLHQDQKALTGLPGVGKKTAARIIVELRDRIGLGMSKESGQALPETDLESEAGVALQALGYSWQEARDAVKKAMEEHPGSDLETLLREALRRLART